MPRPRRKAPDLTPAQAQFVLQRLLAEGRINGTDIRSAVFGMQREIGELEQRLAALRASAGVSMGAARAPRRAAAARAGARKRRAQMSPQVLASRKLQGQYIGYMRQLPERERGRYAELAKSKGREAAITAMKKALGK